MKDSEELETQKQIYLLVSKHPGLNLTMIADMLHISMPLALYHLRYLQKHELIVTRKEEASQRYFIKGEVGSIDKKYFSLFRKETALQIVLILLKYPYLRHKELLSYLSLSPPLLTYYLKKLVQKEIVGFSGDASERRYYIINEREIITFLIKYEPYKILDGISETWTDFSIR